MSKPVVHIVDDDEAVRDSIKELVKSVGMKAKTFENAEALLDVLNHDTYGCIVLDIRMEGMSGLSLHERLIEDSYIIPLIIITGHGDIDMAVTSIKKGALDFIQKPYHEQNLLDSINNAMMIDASNRKSKRQEAISKYNKRNLTNREREILELLITGITNKLIGKQLKISPRTVEVHRQHIFEKYKVHSAAQLIYQVSQPKI